jgi:methionyl-tRNA formyltransferase
MRVGETKLNFANHVDQVYNLIRAANPAPGAWTTLNGKKISIFDSKKELFRTFGGVKGKVGTVSEIGANSFFVTCQGGRIEVLKAKGEETKKIAGNELAAALGLTVGIALGS